MAEATFSTDSARQLADGVGGEGVELLLGQVAVVEDVVVAGHLGVQVIVDLVGVEEGAHPQHAQVAVDGGGEAHPKGTS